MDINDFEPLRTMNPKVVSEIIREAEARLAAQLSMATAADQRALALAGFQIASATAALAGGVALMLSKQEEWLLALLAIVFAGAMLWAASTAVSTARPKRFSVPGNDPAGWLPNNWVGGASSVSLRQARIEQAYCLQLAITENTADGTTAAKALGRSIDVTFWSVALAGVALLLVLAARYLELNLTWFHALLC